MSRPTIPIEASSITLKMLVDAGILGINAILVATQNSNVKGYVNEDGSITINYDGRSSSFQYPSGAARFVEKRSLNGWTYWSVLEGETIRPLNDFRIEYLKKHKNL